MTKSKDGKPVLVVRDSRDGKPLRRFVWPEGGEVRAALSPDGKVMAAASWKGVVRSLDVATGAERRFELPPPWQIPTLPFSCVRFTPDGSRLLVVGVDGMLRVLSAADGRQLVGIQETDTSLGGVGPFVGGVAFSPDGGTLAAGKAWGWLSLWEVATGQLVRQLQGDGLAFSPDNRRVVVRRGGALRLYDLYSGGLVRELRAPGGLDGPLAFSPDGRRLAAACRDTTVLVWDTAPARKKLQPPGAAALERLWKDIEARQPPGPNVEGWKARYVSQWQEVEDGRSARAYEAMGRLIADPERSVPLLRRHLLLPPADPARLRRLLADLGREAFAAREAASRELAKLGRAAGPALRAALAGKVSLETRRRLEKLLGQVEEAEEKLLPAYGRAVQVLEQVGTPGAQELLRILASGAGGRCGVGPAREALRRTRTAGARPHSPGR